MYIIDKSDRELHPDAIEYTEGLFLAVNDKYHSRFREPISVLRDGKFLFNLLWESEFFYLGAVPDPATNIPYCANFDGRCLRESADTLDNTFVGKFDRFVFEAVSEYSWHIIRYLNEFFPEKEIWLLDDASGVFTDIAYKKGRPDKEKAGKTGLFTAGHRLPGAKGVYSLYSLMVSLTWTRIRHHNPDAVSDNTAFVINFAEKHIGFGDMTRISSACVEAARRRGWLPFIRLDHLNQYSDCPGEDGWGKFFEQPSDTGGLTPKDCRTVIDLRENRAYDNLPSCNPYIVSKPCCFPLRLNKAAAADVERRIPAAVRDGGRILGAVIRTTDFDMTENVKTDTERSLAQCEKVFSEGGYDRFFLAAEDQAVVDCAREIFGEKLTVVDQKRVDSRQAGPEGFLSDTLNPLYESKYALGVDYLAVVVSLTGCETVLYNRYAGALYLGDALDTPLRRNRRAVCFDSLPL